MLKVYFFVLFAVLFLFCTNKKRPVNPVTESNKANNYICEIELPKGFQRIKTDSNSFAFYLQHFKLRQDNTVYYFDGTKKANQNLHFAVLDISVPKKNLQQCADAIMRLRAEYFFARNEFSKITFKSTTCTYNFEKYLTNNESTNKSIAFANFMETVFANCGTYNLEEMLNSRQNSKDLTIGDVFVKAGSPGHAMIVVDCAVNTVTKEKIFLLAQSFMPAQSVHIVINPNNSTPSPWYSVDTTKIVITPGYNFEWKHLKTW